MKASIVGTLTLGSVQRPWGLTILSIAVASGTSGSLARRFNRPGSPYFIGGSFPLTGNPKPHATFPTIGRNVGLALKYQYQQEL